VINKMLRDLDQRQAAQNLADTKPDGMALRSGTTRVDSAPLEERTGGRFSKVALAAALTLLALVVGGALWWGQKSPVVAAVPIAPQAVAQPASLPVLATAPSVAPVNTNAHPPSTALAPVASQRVKAVATSNTAHEATAKASTDGPAPAKANLPAAPPAQASMVAPSPPVAASSTVASADAPGTPARQLQAGREALAQAQSLWNAGSHDTAGELLQQALALAERTANAAPTAANTQLLATLAREQARMQMADGRPQAALEGLTRLEPLLGREAEAWAMRGNAAQRLGRHQDSVQAYTTALQLRPNEQRWLLGAAVSLAALGQTANAAEVAAKARAQGPISKEVQSYLRQAGVPLNEP
jgi:hypothetical protein